MVTHVCADPEEAASAAAALLAEAARAGGDITLAGGSTPRRAYELAAALEDDWSRATLWWGDERCVPPDDDRSNYRLAREALLDRLAAAPSTVHRIRGELDPATAAAAYDRQVAGTVFSLVLLGLGPDGHTASLFPRSPALRESEQFAVVTDPGLEPFVERVTLTPPILRDAAHIVFLVAGKDKAHAVELAFSRPPSESVPASLIRSGRGQTTVILDRAAAARL